MSDSRITELWKDLDRQVYLITQLINSTRARLAEMDRTVLGTVPNLSPESTQAISRIQRLLHALEDRMEKITALTSTGREEELSRAVALAASELTCKNDAVHKLLSEESIPPIAFDRVAGQIDELFKIAAQPRRRVSSGLF